MNEITPYIIFKLVEILHVKHKFFNNLKIQLLPLLFHNYMMLLILNMH